MNLIKLRVRNALLLVILLAFVTSTAQAHRQSLVWTKEYLTLSKGEVEIEYFLTTKIPDIHKFDKKNTWEHQLELEYGITDHLTMGIYQTAQNTHINNGHTFDYTGTKIELKYRIAEKNVHPVDMLLYVEYVHGDNVNDKDEMEYKFVLSKDIGDFNITYNQIIEDPVADSTKDTQHEFAAGIYYAHSPGLHLGIEATGNYTADTYRVGPTLSWASKKCWVALGFLRGVDSRTDDIRSRLVVGIPF